MSQALPPMDQEIYLNGTIIVLIEGVHANVLEKWVQKVARVSGQRVDWHSYARWATVKALGDIEKVKQTVQDLASEIGYGVFNWDF